MLFNETVPQSHEYVDAIPTVTNDLNCCRPEDMSFCRPVITRLITALETRPLPNLTPNEQAHLIVLIQTTLEVGGTVIKFQYWHN